MATLEKSVAQKLLIKEGNRVLLMQPPAGYEQVLGALPPQVTFLATLTPPVDLIQLFVHSRQELEARLAPLKAGLTPQSKLWVTYCKGTSKKKSDINRDSIAAYARTLGLEAVAMIAVDSDWSALRLKMVE